jgi:hypothetical protein
LVSFYPLLHLQLCILFALKMGLQTLDQPQYMTLLDPESRRHISNVKYVTLVASATDVRNHGLWTMDTVSYHPEVKCGRWIILIVIYNLIQ